MPKIRPLGETRTSVQRNHAFIAPDSHVRAPHLGWEKSESVTLISPAMGAQFVQCFIYMAADGLSAPPPAGVERFIYVVDGVIGLAAGELEEQFLGAGYFGFIPAGVSHQLRALEPSQLLLFEKRYVVDPSGIKPTIVINDSSKITSASFMGDDAAQLKTLLPTDRGMDMAVNLFTFQPGTALPFVETHIMEHGMILLEGHGIYRLDDSWYPIQKGDVIWMGPYCPQWFAALGKEQATYLYYKDMNRDPLAKS